MERIKIEQSVVTFVLVVCWLFMPATGYDSVDNVLPHLLYMVSHVNVWHLAANLFVLWLMRYRLYLAPSVVIAFLMSYLPAWSIYGDMGVTMGFSGVLFAIVGIKWGLYCGRLLHPDQRRHAYGSFMMEVLPFAVAGVLIPHLNWCLHLYCLLAGFVYGRCRR